MGGEPGGSIHTAGTQNMNSCVVWRFWTSICKEGIQHDVMFSADLERQQADRIRSSQ